MPSEPRKRHATLDKLTAAQQAMVFAYVESHTLMQTCDHLRSELGIEISCTAVGNWARRYRFDLQLKARVDEILRARCSADHLVSQVGDTKSIEKANLALLGQAFMDAQLTGDAAVIEQFGDIYVAVRNAQIKSDRVEIADRGMDLMERRINADQEKFRVSLMKKVDLGMDELLNEIKGNPAALAAFQKMKEAITA